MAGELDAFLISLRADAGGVLLPVRAQPRARREGLLGLRAGALRVGTTAAPEDGRQLDHEILVVQWRAGVKRIVWPPELAETELDPSSL